MAKEKKDPFAAIPEEWRDAVAASTVEQIDARIAELAKNEEENQNNKKEDEDLAEKKEAVKFAAEGYREATKMYKLKMKYVMRVLGDSGKA